MPTLEGKKEIEDFRGKTIHSLHIGKDAWGYDFVRIVTEDGLIFEAYEMGQAGEMSVMFPHVSKESWSISDALDITEEGNTP